MCIRDRFCIQCHTVFLHDAFDVVIVQPMGKGIIEVGVNQTYQFLILLHDDAFGYICLLYTSRCV